MKQRLLAGLLALLGVLILPNLTMAAKLVSQHFPRAQMVFLPLKHHDAYVLSDHTFYTTEFPGMAGTDWYDTGTSLPLEADRIYTTADDASIGVRLNGYTYFVLLTGDTPAPDAFESNFDTIEIWRVKQNTSAIERVASWNTYTEDSTGEKTYFEPVNLVKYNHALYLLQSDGVLQHSSDGVRWYEADTSDILDNTTEQVLYHLQASPTGLYITTGGFGANPAIYYSADSMSWQQLAAAPFMVDAGNVEALTSFGGSLYAAVSNVTGTEYQLWQYNGTVWTSLMTTAQQVNLVDHSATALYITQYEVETNARTIHKSVDGGTTFTEVYKTTNPDKSFIGRHFIKSLAKPVFMIRDLSAEESTYLLRVK